MEFEHSDLFKQLCEAQNRLAAIYAEDSVEKTFIELFLKESKHEAENKINNCNEKEETWPQEVTSVNKDVRRLGIREECKFVKVESDYYDWPLETRALRVNSPSKAHMCKCVIMENKRWKEEFRNDKNNFKVVCVIVQYVDSIDTSKLADFIRGFQETPRSRKNYNFRLIEEKESERLTGFKTKGVATYGFRNTIPMVMSERIASLKPPILVLGAGHPDWKLVLPISTFLDSTNCLVANISAVSI
ncbi:hypothetical protein BB559_006040 [Furculomyces boomerangus]|uniref:YbaK/aminoacyl-tRNA synthetase-associated domain-containing protein n=2 Tax=Harpellales TaxID=61421 RepID=A0A2T9Y542_9FUNG|nr:hypothetical protein BB559_006040 [Furculomyces boomerangus]PWA02242.1 hypothetical protein BB558_001632 [Smittium angustum]